MEDKPILLLVIDHDPASRKFLADRLGLHDYSVLTAPSGKEGLITAWQHLPQVIIIDPALPDIDGLELITRLRQDRRTTSVRCIVLSGHNDPGKAQKLISAGFDEYLVKSNQALDQILLMIPRLLSPEKPTGKQGNCSSS